MDESELEITICKSEMTKFLGAEVGVKILHKKTGVVVRSTKFTSQHLNKMAALELLHQKLKNRNNS